MSRQRKQLEYDDQDRDFGMGFKEFHHRSRRTEDRSYLNEFKHVPADEILGEEQTDYGSCLDAFDDEE